MRKNKDRNKIQLIKHTPQSHSLNIVSSTIINKSNNNTIEEEYIKRNKARSVSKNLLLLSIKIIFVIFFSSVVSLINSLDTTRKDSEINSNINTNRNRLDNYYDEADISLFEEQFMSKLVVNNITYIDFLILNKYVHWANNTNNNTEANNIDNYSFSLFKGINKETVQYISYILDFYNDTNFTDEEETAITNTLCNLIYINATPCSSTCNSERSICLYNNIYYTEKDREILSNSYNIKSQIMKGRFELDEHQYLFNDDSNNKDEEGNSNINRDVNKLPTITDYPIFKDFLYTTHIKCICSYGYSTFITSSEFSLSNNYKYCNYSKKSGFLAGILEIAYGFGIGHLYTKRYIEGIIKLIVYTILWYGVYIIYTLQKKIEFNQNSLINAILEVINSNIIMIIRLWQIFDGLFFVFLIYKDGNGMDLVF